MTKHEGRWGLCGLSDPRGAHQWRPLAPAMPFTDAARLRARLLGPSAPSSARARYRQPLQRRSDVRRQIECSVHGMSAAAHARMTHRSVVLALVRWISLLAPTARADALVAGFDSSHAGESAFLTVIPGQTYGFQVFFMKRVPA
ncbi:MAG TPA: hypothetical protein VGR87_03540 [Candidatus Limnocylindria bacterium]|nr:hypothetical protein [Candidatus Limnocylindria bacterium]